MVLSLSMSYPPQKKTLAGSEAVLEVVISAFQRLSEDIESKELDFILKYLYTKITKCVIGGSIFHLSHLLSLLISIVQIHNGRMVYGES